MNMTFKKAYPYLATGLVLAPAMLALAWPRDDHAYTVARSIQLQGPIINFAQKEKSIRVRLAQPDASQNGAVPTHLIVRSSDMPTAQEVRIPVRTGQIYVTARLPETLAVAGSLNISLEYALIAAR